VTLIATPPPSIVDHAEPPPGTWEREASHFPAPVSPFTKSLLLVEDWSRQLTAETGSLIETVRFIEIGGWVYMRPVPFGERPGAPNPPDWLVPLLMRVVPTVRRRMATARRALDEDWSGRQIDGWYRRRDGLASRIADLQHADRPGMTDRDLDEHVRAVIALGHECMELHFRLHAAMARDLRAFTVTGMEVLGWDADRCLSMLVGTSTASTAAGQALAELAAIAGRRDEVVRLIGDAPVDQVLAADREFAEAFADYLARFCFRAITYDVTDPLLAERPELVLGLVRDQLALVNRPTPGDGSGVIDEARTRLAARSAADRARFEERLAKALRAYPVREDNVYVTVCAPIALLRTAGLELGRRLADRGRLESVDDVFLLQVDEARSALVEGSAVRDLVERRRRDRECTLAHPGPARYGPEAPRMPNLQRLPAPARENVTDLLWLLDEVTPTLGRITSDAGSPVIDGTAAARGSARGPVRIVRDETEFDKLQAGDVLVCECTSPAWSIVFPSLSAVVTNSGGILSHPAIVAREFGIPAVVATGDATSRLQDGQQVVVDGTAGTVRVVS